MSQMNDVLKNLRNPFKSLTSTSSLTGEDEKSAEDEHKGNFSNLEDCEIKPLDTSLSSISYRDPRKQHFSIRSSYTHSRSRSRTPPACSRSNTPEPTQSMSPKPFDQINLDPKEIVYDRPTMYDYSEKFAAEDEEKRANDQRMKNLKNMRYLPGGSASGIGSRTGSGALGSEFDLNLPFKPITNYTPATEIDGSITSHLPMNYKIIFIDVERPNYIELRENFKSDNTLDPRLRRILGLPELSQTKKSAALRGDTRSTSKNSQIGNIASPDSSDEQNSPKYYTPPTSLNATTHVSNSNTATGSKNSKPTTPVQTVHRGDPRMSGGDPRRKQHSNTSANLSNNNLSRYRGESSGKVNGGPAADTSVSTSVHQQHTSTATTVTSSTTSSSVNLNGGQKQNLEIRNLLQKSEWYKNLNSKFKIMVNQQLALVSTELKKFHQDPSPNKIFDISFIVSNTTLQQILTNLGIYIDDNGEVVRVDTESDDNGEMTDADRQQPLSTGQRGSHRQKMNNTASDNMNYINMNQPPPIQSAANKGNNNNGNNGCNNNGFMDSSIGNGNNSHGHGHGHARGGPSHGPSSGAPMDFLRAPPPCLGAGNNGGGGVGNGPAMFQRTPMPIPQIYNARPSLLGMPPIRPFNPFGQATPGGPGNVMIDGPQFIDGSVCIGGGPAMSGPPGLMGPFMGGGNNGIMLGGPGMALNHSQQQQQPPIRNRNHRHQIRRNKI